MSEGGYTGWQIGSGFLTVGAHSEVDGKSVHPGRIIWNIETPDVKGDFDASRPPEPSWLPSRTVSRASSTWIATFADPDDNYFQLMSPMVPNRRRASRSARAWL